MEITVLVENLAYKQGTKGEHGLSILIKVNNKNILFDTGQSGLLVENAKAMNIDLSAIDMVVISHGHYDHTGGLEAFFEINKNAPVYLKPQAFEEKMSLTTGKPRYIGLDKKVIKKYASRFKTINETKEIAPGLTIVTQINSYYPFEKGSTNMIVEKGGQQLKDPFDDELFMVYEEGESLTVLTGCAHRGIANICRTAIDVSGGKKIKSVLGGTHLKNASHERIVQTLKTLETFDIDNYGLCHCTGLQAFMQFSQQYKDKVKYAHVGTHF